jgi:AcrR family transcriptional regulator
MAVKRPQSSECKPRADAQRNRERILEVAKQAFTRLAANASLDDIAKEAGVGPGTLYRDFPTRDELLEAVYRTELEKLAATERKFAETMPPIEALRAWMLLFVDYIATKKIIAPALNTPIGGRSKVWKRPTLLFVKPCEHSSRVRLKAARHVKTSIPWIYFGLWSEERIWSQVLIGSKARGAWWISSSPIRGTADSTREFGSQSHLSLALAMTVPTDLRIPSSSLALFFGADRCRIVARHITRRTRCGIVLSPGAIPHGAG